MGIMSNATQYSDSEDTFTSTDCSDCSDNESSETDKDDTSDTASYRSLAFRVRKNRSTVTIKSKKRNKRVRFRPGDSLVLIYVIPNREMLGLKSESEDSESGDDSDDDGDDDEDEDDDEEEDDDDYDDESDDENECKKRKEKIKKPKPFAKLLAVRQVNRCNLPDIRNNNRKSQEKPKLVKLNLNTASINSKKVPRSKPNRKEIREKTNSAKRDSKSSADSKAKQSRNKKNKFNAIKTDNKVKRNVSRLLEIHATVRPTSKHQETHTTVPKLIYKNDTKPSVINVNSSVAINNATPLTNRARLQTTSFRITKLEAGSVMPQNTHDTLRRPKSSAHVVTACYDSVSGVLPSSYVRLNSFDNTTVKETIKRLDPDSMNTSGKRNYAWQIANGTITSQSLRTPSILPFWDSLQNSVQESSSIKLPT